MSYIKKEPLLQIAKEIQGKVFGAPLIVRAIENAPEEDVVEVVRCKDCKYCHKETRWNGEKYFGCYQESVFDMETTYPDHYCSYGERREEDD